MRGVFAQAVNQCVNRQTPLGELFMICLPRWHRPCNKDRHNQTILMKTQSTYSLFVKSQETGRSIFETAVNTLMVLSSVVAIFQFAAQSVIVPTHTVGSSASSAIVAKADAATVSARS